MLLRKILNDIADAGGRGLLVGGAVRDMLIGCESKDVDVEVYRLMPVALRRILLQYGRVEDVGASFGVTKLSADGQSFDFSVPRKERKVGEGHRGFEIDIDPLMHPAVACLRRDFTMNAIAYDPLVDEFIDPAGGLADLSTRVLRHTSEQFAEDPLRVLRGFQFVGRFELEPADETVAFSESLLGEYRSLSIERVWGEWAKWASKSTRPSLGLEFLKKTGWLHLYGGLSAMVGCPQEPEWHPEGDVWKHTLLAVDAAAEISVREKLDSVQRAVLVLAALCHDIGKPPVTTKTDGRIRSYGHSSAGAVLASVFLQSLGAPQHIADQVCILVERHMAHLNATTKRTVRRLTVDISPVPLGMLSLLMETDYSARSPLPGGMPPEAEKMMAIACEIGIVDKKPKAVLMGRHLLDCGLMRPGPDMGRVLRVAYEAQLDGAFDDLDGAITWLNDRAGSSLLP